MHMVYNINNRMIYRGFHGDSAGKDKITKPDGKVVKGKWIYGCMAIIPMPVPDGAKPQMPILCLHSPERWGRVWATVLSIPARCLCSPGPGWTLTGKMPSKPTSETG